MYQYDLYPNMLVETPEPLDAPDVELAREKIAQADDVKKEFHKWVRKFKGDVVHVQPIEQRELVTMPRGDYEALLHAANSVADGETPDPVTVNVIEHPPPSPPPDAPPPEDPPVDPVPTPLT